MKFKTLTAAALLLGAASLASAADAFTVDSRHSEAMFRVRHFMSKVSGKFADVTGVVNVDKANPAASSVNVIIKTATIDTGVADRDKHLRSADFFDTDKFPEITFKSTKIAATSRKDVFDVTGDFTMHGITKQITMPVEVLGWQSNPQGERVGFSIATTVNRKDYGVIWNRALDNGGFMLGDDVEVNIAVEAVKRNAPPAPAPAAVPPATSTKQ
jgi:polyisoprenoid-binding protein YceI